MSPTAPLLLDRRDCALLVVDVQEKLLPHIHEGERVRDSIVRLVRFAEILGIPVLAAEQGKLGPTVGPIREALQGVEPAPKLAFSALGCPAISQRLAELGKGALIVTGIEAHICVAQTVLQALPSFAVHVVADAVGSRSPENCRIALDRLRGAGAVVTTSEMLMYELMVEAGTDEFRRVLPLVK
ncbi:MAG: isochorismatase family protein [Deltaproteobacteria bacterium]|nr:isochorismatase family protein [Deltaproteobacteria bacterium]